MYFGEHWVAEYINVWISKLLIFLSSLFDFTAALLVSIVGV